MAFIPHNVAGPAPCGRGGASAGALACVLVLLTSAAPAAAAPAAAAAVGPAPSGEKIVDAASTVVDYKAQTAEYKDVVLRQDDVKVQADRAHAVGLTLDKSDWTFEGNVRVQSEQRGSLHSDQAVVEIRNNRLTRVTVNGMPAEFEQKRADSDQLTHGQADEIVYDVSDGTVRLSKDAWLSVGGDKMSSALIVYNIREQKLQASVPAGTDGRVHMTISPSGKIEPKKQP